MPNPPKPEQIRDLLEYDPDTGNLKWKARARGLFRNDSAFVFWNRFRVGRDAFTAGNGDGYRTGAIFGRHLQAHRVIWAIVHGEWPHDQIDHINGNRSDNRLANLRSVTKLENGKNCKRSKRNTSGHTGVYWEKRNRKWLALICVDRKIIRLGLHGTKTEAIAARKSAELEFGFHHNHGRATAPV